MVLWSGIGFVVEFKVVAFNGSGFKYFIGQNDKQFCVNNSNVYIYVYFHICFSPFNITEKQTYALEIKNRSNAFINKEMKLCQKTKIRTLRVRKQYTYIYIWKPPQSTFETIPNWSCVDSSKKNVDESVCMTKCGYVIYF